MVTKVKGGVLDESALSGKNMTGDIAFDTSTLKIDSSNNRVGIGTASPDELLVVDGAAKIRGTNKLSFTNTSDQTYIHAPASNTLAFGAGSAERMRLASDGDFFLNTTSAMDNCFASFQDGNNGEAMFGISAKDDSNIGIRFGVGTTRKWVNYRDTSDNLIWYSNANSAERMRIRSDGGVGIGHTGYSSTLLSLHNGTGRSTLIYGDSGDANCDISLRDNSSSQNIVYGATGNNHIFKKDTTEQMRIDSSGAVIVNNAGGDAQIYLGGSSGTSRMYLARSGSDSLLWNVSNANLRFGTNNTERMRIDSSGNVLIAGTSFSAIDGATEKGIALRATAGRQINCLDSGANAFEFSTVNNGNAGEITCTGTSTNYSTSSDYRLKNVKGNVEDALERTLKLNPVVFEWKADKRISEGFIAHEAQEIFADAVTGEKDGEKMQSMDYGRITPLLVKAIQELTAEVEELKAKVESK
jgi:hypothetical protein